MIIATFSQLLMVSVFHYVYISMFYISVICSEGHMVDWPSS